LIESAPMVVPWYAMWREIAFQRFCSPRRLVLAGELPGRLDRLGAA
jgi:hypothetical protein